MNEPDQRPRWQLRTLKDAYKPRPPTEYVVDRFFATHSLNIVYGAPGSLKSMLLADMCIHIVSGLPWLPDAQGGISVKQSPVMWIDMDNGTRRTDARFDALGKTAKLSEDAPFFYVSMPTPVLIAHELEPMEILRDTIAENGVKLVVIDNLGLILGNADENSAQMAQIMSNLRLIAERTGAALVLIHHQRKGGANGSRAGDALRGHSSIEASIDLAIQVIREPGTDNVITRSTKTRDVPVPNAGAKFIYTHVWGTNDLESAWFEGSLPKRGEGQIKEIIMDILDREGKMGKSKLSTLVYDELQPDGPGINKIRAWIDDMIAVDGTLLETAEGKYKVLSLA